VAGVVAALGTVAFSILPTPARPSGRDRVRRRAFVPPRELFALTRLPTVQVSCSNISSYIVHYVHVLLYLKASKLFELLW
jgi:hypothetical protein